MPLDNWLGFCLIAVLASATPGPAVLLTVVNSIKFGTRGAMISVLGNITGLLVMSAGSVAGLTALVLHSALAFSVVKWLGALYLIYLGIKLWRHGLGSLNQQQVHNAQQLEDRLSSAKLYGQGLLVALTNPKAIVFTTALFPQFINSETALLPQFMILVISFMLQSFVCLSLYALLATKLKVFTQTRALPTISNHRTWLTTQALLRKHLSKLVGSVFIGAGCFTASMSR
ncbi:LysE family translocator [Motilimonas pumila]|uniref:LysE family translocator n=1 Tax=Motilimonas pumila TaxID=2303987 RepID=A0A418YCZ0_9GAMM|nr:LysE family translocator [Motilimonas pumila]RJG42391.1 LysE family translocator [Motilimonas pumila]